MATDVEVSFGVLLRSTHTPVSVHSALSSEGKVQFISGRTSHLLITQAKGAALFRIPGSPKAGQRTTQRTIP